MLPNDFDLKTSDLQVLSNRDAVVALFANLDYNTSAQRKQAEQKRFLGWLEGVLKIGLDAITGKTILRNYLGDYQKGQAAATFEAIQDVLFKNRNTSASA